MKSRQRPPMRRAAHAGALVEELLQQKGMTEKLRAYRAWLIWADTVGPQIAARARPVRVREGILEVRVDHPVWMQQLQLLKPRLLARLNARLEGDPLRDIFLRRGPVSPPAEEPAAAPAVSWLQESLSAEEQQRIERLVATLPDPELRPDLHRLLTKQAKLEKSRRTTS